MAVVVVVEAQETDNWTSDLNDLDSNPTGSLDCTFHQLLFTENNLKLWRG